jgi:hypothetical protein
MPLKTSGWGGGGAERLTIVIGRWNSIAYRGIAHQGIALPSEEQ